MEISREEMLEFAKLATFQLDDRLVPFDRETLRAEAWLMGHEMSKRFPLVSADKQDMKMQISALQCECKGLHEEISRREDIIKLMQQTPEPSEPVCGDMVVVHSTQDRSIEPIVAWWYGVNRNIPKNEHYLFIEGNGDKHCFSADEVRLEKASPDVVVDAVKRRLRSLVEEDAE